MSELWLPEKQKSPPPQLKWQFNCPMRWDDLKPTTDQNVKFCDKCRETVHYVTSFGNFLESVEKGRCVSVDMGDYGTMFEGKRQDENAPCAVKREQPKVDYQMPQMLGRTVIVSESRPGRSTRGRVFRRKKGEK